MRDWTYAAIPFNKDLKILKKKKKDMQKPTKVYCTAQGTIVKIL